MANFNLENYETVDERVARFYADFPKGRIETDLLDSSGEINATRWVVKARVYRGAEDDRPAGVGHAFEVDGGGGANRAAALENAETSAVGRALAQAGFTGNKRITREEARKAAVVDIMDRAAVAEEKSILQDLWKEASKIGVLDAVQDTITDRVQWLTDHGIDAPPNEKPKSGGGESA